MAPRVIELKPLTLSSEKMAPSGKRCTKTRQMAMRISAPPGVPQPSCSGVLQLLSRASSSVARPLYSRARHTSSHVGAVPVSRSPTSSLICSMMHLPTRRRRAEPMPIGLVPPSGLRSPTRKQSPRRGRRLSWIRPAAILKKRRKRTSLARFDEWYSRPSSSYESASPENMARSLGTRAITL